MKHTKRRLKWWLAIAAAGYDPITDKGVIYAELQWRREQLRKQ